MKPRNRLSWVAMLLTAATVAAEGVGGAPVATADRCIGFAHDTTLSSCTLGHHFRRRRIDTAFISPRALSLIRCKYERKRPIMALNFASSADDDTNSEMDIIKILRAHYNRNGYHGIATQHHSGGEEMKTCQTIFDVLSIMNHASSIPIDIELSSSSLDNLLENELLHEINPIVDGINANIAAAALRRLSSPPFLRMTNGNRGYKRTHYMSNNMSSVENMTYDVLMQLLLQKLSTSMKNQLKALSSTATQRDNDIPALLKQRDTVKFPKSLSNMNERKVLNWYAVADLLHSLSNLSNIRGSTSIESGSIMSLFETTIQYLSWNNAITSSFVRCIGPRRLIRDVIQPLVTMVMSQKNIVRQDTDGWMYTDENDITDGQSFASTLSNIDYKRLMTVTSSYLVLPHSLEKLSARDLSTTLWSMTKLLQDGNTLIPTSNESQPNNAFGTEQKKLLRTFMKRLRKYSVRSSARGRELVQAVWSVSRMVSFLLKQNTVQQNSNQNALLPLPIRLPGEDDDSDSFPLLLSQDRDITPLQKTTASFKDIPTESLHEEAIIMFHTLVNDITQPPYYLRNNKSRDFASMNKHEVDKIKLHSLSLGQIEDILQSAKMLQISHDEITTVIVKILEYLTTPSKSSPVDQCRNCKDIARLLLSLQRFRVGTGIYDNAQSVDNGNTGQLEQRCVQLLGERFLDIVLWYQQQSKKCACDAKTLATIVRASTMMYQGNSTATRAILDAASILILGDNTDKERDVDDWASSLLLSSSNEYEVSNYLFAFALARRFDRDIFVALTDRMTDYDILGSCTPSSASRTMWSSAMLLSLDEPNNNIVSDLDSGFGGGEERLFDLFHQLCPLLLTSTSLSPTDISCAMWAMAKSEYLLDRGIFDQLAESMASEKMLQCSNTRLVSQALWACGKLVEFDVPLVSEDPGDDDDSSGDGGSIECDDEATLNLPPYVKYSHKYLQYLIANKAQMTPKHISQSIWAIGRLRLTDYVLISQMGSVACEMGDSLNTREIANIVWGLSKVDCLSKDEKRGTITTLIRHLISSPKLMKDCNAQEASMMLLALGKLGIADEDSFSALTLSLMDNLHGATSQTITNALYAHEQVNLAPPSGLLMSWTKERLGMQVPEGHDFPYC